MRGKNERANKGKGKKGRQGGIRGDTTERRKERKREKEVVVRKEG